MNNSKIGLQQIYKSCVTSISLRSIIRTEVLCHNKVFHSKIFSACNFDSEILTSRLLVKKIKS